MKRSRITPEDRLKKELELAREAFRLIAEGKMPSHEEIERAAREAVSEALLEMRSSHDTLSKGTPNSTGGQT